MAELKTKITDKSPLDYINSIANPSNREDSLKLYSLMREITGEEGKMWGTSMIGFGLYPYTYASGRKGEWFIIGFAPRTANITIYNMSGYEWQNENLLQLGKYKTGKSCLYIKKLNDIDIEILRSILTESYQHMKNGGNPLY